MKNCIACNSWMVYFHERFPLYISIPLVLFFVLGNAFVAIESMGSYFHLWRTLIAFLMCVSFFYRLVIFSDLRDYRDDCIWHPEKALARGLLTVRRATIGAFALIIWELFLTSLVGIDSFLAHLLPIGWSLLMWQEFFAPKWLSLRPTLYTMIRSPVLALCGFSVGVTTLEIPLTSFPFYFFLFGIANWAIFNLFTFSIHSCYARDAVNFRDIWGHKGAFVLIFSQGVIASVIGLNIWLFLGLIPVAIVGYLWAMRITSKVTGLMHEVNFTYILYYYFILSLALLFVN